MADGVWRTVGGRRIFIKEGQDLATAMKESGKFNTKKETKKEIIDKNTIEFGNKIKNQDKESAIVYDDDGKEIIFKDGEKYKVEFKGKELQELKNMNFIHNHPTDSAYDSMFSKQDLMFAYDNDLKSMITINKNGDIIKLERDKNIKFDSEHKPGFLAGDYEREKIANAKGKGISELPEVANHMDNWMKENAEKYGYKYERKLANEKNETEIKTKTKKSIIKYSNEELYNMNSRELATLIVEDQINRGVIKPENKEYQINRRLSGSSKMSKKQLYDYAIKYLK